jgi:GT2 family glycosyltransferase
VERTWHELRASREIEHVAVLPSGNLILTRSAFEAVGGFDEGFATGEDTDLCLRLKKAGYRLVACSAIKVVHLNEPKTLGDLYRKQLWHGRGMLKVARRHYRTGAAIVPLVSLGYLAGFMAILVFVALGLFAPAALTGLFLVLIAPALFSLIKRAQGKRTLLPASMAFYLVYFAARASSLVRYNQWKDLVGTSR